jgi:hypothetical protein
MWRLTILKGLHLITQSTPNGQKVQILLEELAETYGTEFTTTVMYVRIESLSQRGANS